MGLLLKFSWDFFVIPILCPVISIIFLWDFCEIPMEFPWYFFKTTIGNNFKLIKSKIKLFQNKLKLIKHKLKLIQN